MSGMKVIKPTSITTAVLTSSTVAEPAAGEAVWSAATAYAQGAVVIRTTTHMKYERVVAGTTATPPENDTTNWIEAGPTLRWAMFDRKIGTATTAATSVTVVTRPGSISGLGMLELVGRQASITLKDAPGGTTVYSRTVNLDGTQITSVYEWFFLDFEQLTDFVLTDIPQHYAACELTVQVTSTTPVSIGVLQVGQVIVVGSSQKGATVGIIDYSKKEKDRFGNWDMEKNWLSVHNYLTQKRGLPHALVQAAHDQGLIYASERQNAVFLMRSLSGELNGALLRGTRGEKNEFMGYALGTKRN